jgi:16S rRNA (guanine966-N2)-methyltransferase
MRIIAGSARGRRLVAPAGRSTRPITDRAKEGIFNMLMSLGGVEDMQVLDLYAGAGSFGLECLSRGASHVTFVERGRPAATALRRNLESLGFQDRATVLTVSVEQALLSLAAGPGADGSSFDLAFCDPPYADDPWPDLMLRVPARLLVGHASTEIPLGPGWAEVKRRSYGRAQVLMAERS